MGGDSIFLNNGLGGTLTVFGATDAMNLESLNTLNNGVTEVGTIIDNSMLLP